MMKKLTVILALVLAAALLTACGDGKPKTTEAPKAAEASAATEAPAATETPEATETPGNPEAPAAETPAAEEEPAEIPGQADQPADATGTLPDRIDAVAKDAADLVPFTADELMDMTGIGPKDYTDFVFLQGDGMDGREILVVRAANEAAADRVAGQMEKYLERRQEENRNYAPAAYQLLSEAKVVRKGLLLAMISGADAAAETEALLAGE